jgi:hypothetical protein
MQTMHGHLPGQQPSVRGPAAGPIGPLHLEEEPTAHAPQSAFPLANEFVALQAPMHLDDEDTANMSEEQARALMAGRRRARDSAFEEPTRAMDWATMDELRGSPPGGRVPPGPPSQPVIKPSNLRAGAPRPVAPGGRPGPARPNGVMTRQPDEDTASVDLKRVPSLSEVDWDLD